MDLYGVIGTKDTDQLLSDPMFADKIVIACTPNKGIVKRGTLMFRETTGLYSPAASGDVVNTNVFAILDDAVDTTGTANDDGKTVAEEVNAYRSGCFINGRVTLAADAAITDAHKAVLIRQDIKFDPIVSTAEFDNAI